MGITNDNHLLELYHSSSENNIVFYSMFDGFWRHHKSTCKSPLLMENEEIDHSIEPIINLVTPITVRAKHLICRTNPLELV